MKRCTWKSDCLVTPWFYAIARRELIDAFRRHGKRVQRPIQ
jgi:DNA-directed RNA polymerase specialized sigma24 family protein